MRLFRRWGFLMDERLVLSTLPYILAGSSLRVIEDADLVAAPWRYLLITPLIFFLVFLITAASLLLTRKIRGEEFHASYAAVGLIWTLLNLVVLSTVGIQERLGHRRRLPPGISPYGRHTPLPADALPALGFLDDRFNLMIIYAHMLDASSTYIGVDWFSYYEKHVVPTFLIDLTGRRRSCFP